MHKRRQHDGSHTQVRPRKKGGREGGREGGRAYLASTEKARTHEIQ